MERKVTKLEHSHIEVLVTVDEASWKAAQKKAFDKAASKVQVDGFRQGKAPEHLVKAKVNQAQVLDDAINGLLPVVYKDILDNEDIKPVAQPKVDVTKLSDTDLEVKFVLVVAPEVELGAYKGIEIGHDKVEVTEEDVKKAIDGDLAKNASLIIKDGAAAKGDIVNMDFKGTIDGVEFEGGAAENHELELGSGQFIPGFEDQLVGAKAGDHVDVKVTFPENYVETLKGKNAVFACDVHEVKEKKLPELNDEFVKDAGIAGVETVDAYREHVKAALLNNKTAEEKRNYLGKLTAKIVEASKIDLPEEIIEQQVASRKEDLVARMKQSGLELADYLKFVGQTEDAFNANVREEAIREVKHYFVMEKIATVEKVEVTDKDLEAEYKKIADQYKMKVEDVKKALAAQVGEFRNNLRMGRVEELLIANNK